MLMDAIRDMTRPTPARLLTARVLGRSGVRAGRGRTPSAKTHDAAHPGDHAALLPGVSTRPEPLRPEGHVMTRPQRRLQG